MPLSPYISILYAGVLANKILENKDIKWITVRGNEIRISQHAADTTMILDVLYICLTGPGASQ